MRLFKRKVGIGTGLFVDRPVVTVFVVNFCIMTLELVAGRMVAPYVGVSLYTWTAVIGVVLLGMTIGNYYGGKLADIRPSKEVVGLLLGASGLSALLTIVMVQMFGESVSLSGFPYLLQVFLVTLVFLLPSMMLGTISPMLVKLSVKSLKKTGKVVGTIYAAAALGSIVGTYVTGFVLISTFGVRMIVIIVTVVLLLTAASFIDFRRLLSKKKLALIGVIFLAFVGFQYVTDFCFRESRYYCIKVSFNEETSIKRLALDKLVHSMTDMGDPGNIVYEYEQLFAVFYEDISENNPRVLFLGGGGYTLPRFLVYRYSEPKAAVVEIDPAVSEVAFEEFDMPRESTIVTVNQDARMFMRDLDPKVKYELMFGDAFSDFSIPYHLTTREFNELVLKHLTQDGIYAVNVIDQLKPGLFLKAYVRTLRQTFDYVYLFLPEADIEKRDYRSTFVVVASQAAVNLERLEMAREQLGYDETILQLYPVGEMDELLNSQGKAVVLSDDFAPADNLLAPVYIGSVPSFSRVLNQFWREIKEFRSLFEPNLL